MPTATTRGFNESDMRQVATWICDIVDAVAKGSDIEAEIARVRSAVAELCRAHPVYRQGQRGAA